MTRWHLFIITVFWAVTLRSLVDGNSVWEEPASLIFRVPWRWRQPASCPRRPQSWYSLPREPQTSHNFYSFIFLVLLPVTFNPFVFCIQFFFCFILQSLIMKPPPTRNQCFVWNLRPMWEGMQVNAGGLQCCNRRILVFIFLEIISCYSYHKTPPKCWRTCYKWCSSTSKQAFICQMLFIMHVILCCRTCNSICF
jgi:hypothetical protein